MWSGRHIAAPAWKPEPADGESNRCGGRGTQRSSWSSPRPWRVPLCSGGVRSSTMPSWSDPALLVIDLRHSPAIDASAIVMLLQVHRELVCADGHLLMRGAVSSRFVRCLLSPGSITSSMSRGRRGTGRSPTRGRGLRNPGRRPYRSHSSRQARFRTSLRGTAPWVSTAGRPRACVDGGSGDLSAAHPA